MTSLVHALSCCGCGVFWLADSVILKQDMQDGLNYGLFCPPDNGRAGKFMDEERLLTDYSLPGPIGYLEVMPPKKVTAVQY